MFVRRLVSVIVKQEPENVRRNLKPKTIDRNVVFKTLEVSENGYFLLSV